MRIRNPDLCEKILDQGTLVKRSDTDFILKVTCKKETVQLHTSILFIHLNIARDRLHFNAVL